MRFALIFLITLTATFYIPELNCHIVNKSNTHIKYYVRIFIDYDNLLVSGSLVLSFRNNHNVSFKSIYLHVYPNAFKDNGGWIKIHDVNSILGSNILGYRIQGFDETILNITLINPLKPGELLKINVTFTIKVPVVADRFGYNNGIMALGNALPILAVYDEDGWNLDPYVRSGESFYSEIANYDVIIMTDPDVVIAATGNLINTSYNGNLKIEHWYAEKVRDFAIVASKDFKVYTVKYENVTIYSYYKSEHEYLGKEAAKIGYKAIKAYSENIGFYAYNELRIVEVDFWAGGMEYPMLVMIASSLYVPSRFEYLELVIAHEIGHQWWYGAVGNDQNDEPWLDEGLTEYTTIMYFEWNYGWKRGRDIFYKYYKNRYYRFLSYHGDYPIADTMYFFAKKPYIYFTIVYKKGACVLDMLRHMLGDETFFNILRTFYVEYKYKIARIRDFIAIAEKVSDRDLSWFFDHWLYGRGVVKYQILNATTYRIFFGYVLQVCIKRLEPEKEVKMLVPIEIKTERGTTTKWIWVNNTIECITLTLSDRPLTVIIDPQDIILGEDIRSPVPVTEVEGRGIPVTFLLQLSVLIVLFLLNIIIIKKVRE